MIIYIVVFVISIFLLYLKNRVKNKWLKKILIILALMLPCILAGLRHHSIGTDVDVYVSRLFDLAVRSKSFSDFLTLKWWRVWTYVYVSDFEIGFTFFVYLISKMFSNLQVLLFFIQLLIIIPIYIGVRKNEY